MSDPSSPWTDLEGLKRVKSLTPENIIELRKLQVQHLSRPHRAVKSLLGENTVESRTHSQAQSFFFRLPGELREDIYQRLLALPRPLHIQETGDRLVSWECTREGELNLEYGDWFCCSQPDALFDDVLTGRRRRSWILGLLRSCRRIYLEAICYLYSLNAFHLHLNHPTTLQRFASGPQLYSIRSLHLTVLPFTAHYINSTTHRTWPATCALLKQMTNLQSLRISLTTHHPRYETQYYLSRLMNFGFAKQPLDPSPLLDPLRGIAAPDLLVDISPNGHVYRWSQQLDDRIRPKLDAEWWFFGYPVVLRSWDYDTDTELD